MSGALETAAGAFAVVGVADVLVRTGRELYRFLRDVKDAPNEIAQLQDLIKETLLLHDASAKCQEDLKASRRCYLQQQSSPLTGICIWSPGSRIAKSQAYR